MHREQEKFIDYCEDNGIITRMSINPLMLTEARSEKLLNSKLSELYISLDGGDNESYRKIRGKAANYDKAVEQILKFVQMKVEKGLSRPKVLIGMVLMGETEKMVETFEKMWSIPGVDERVIKQFSSFGANEDIAELGTEEGKERLFKENRSPLFVAKERKYYDCLINYNAPLKDFEFYKIFDPHTAYQEISMYMYNFAEPMKEIPEISDETMAEIKGFDKWSFRKEPKKGA